MYKQIGKKLKVLAELWCLVGVLGAVAAGVLLYLGKMPLWSCIAIGVGGIILAILSSWGIYALGDIHTKLERLEDKLIPKPAYAEYLAGSTPVRGACEICGRTTDLINAKIEDQMGVRYRKVCRDCFVANKCSEA